MITNGVIILIMLEISSMLIAAYFKLKAIYSNMDLARVAQ